MTLSDLMSEVTSELHAQQTRVKAGLQHGDTVEVLSASAQVVAYANMKCLVALALVEFPKE